MPSSVIRWFRYEEPRRVLRVGFTSGEVYDYEPVPPEVVEGLKTAPSQGRFFGSEIRDQYGFRRVTDGSVR